MIARNNAGQGANAKNLISKLRYWQESRFTHWSLPATWSRARQIALANPVSRGDRLPKPDGRTRRLFAGEEFRLVNAARNSHQ